MIMGGIVIFYNWRKSRQRNPNLIGHLRASWSDFTHSNHLSPQNW